MNKEVLTTVGLTTLGVVVALIIRDNMPSGSFSFKKGA